MIRADAVEPTVDFPEPPVAKWLFVSTQAAWLWLILRLWLGWEWLQSGWGKVFGGDINFFSRRVLPHR